MAGFNKVIILGRLGKDPEVRNLEGGSSVASFSVATSENYTDKSGTKQEKTQWHNVVCWRRLAEIAGQYLKKGSEVMIEGKIEYRNYQDKDNNTKYITEIIAESFQMIGSKQSSGGGQSYAPDNNYQQSESKSAPAKTDLSGGGSGEIDDLPF